MSDCESMGGLVDRKEYVRATRAQLLKNEGQREDICWFTVAGLTFEVLHASRKAQGGAPTAMDRREYLKAML